MPNLTSHQDLFEDFVLSSLNTYLKVAIFPQRTHLSSCYLGAGDMGSGPIALQLMSCVPRQDTAFSAALWTRCSLRSTEYVEAARDLRVNP